MNFRAPKCPEVAKSSTKSSNQFYCSYCDYYTSRKSNYVKHLKTAKHLKKMSPKCPKVSKSSKKVANDKSQKIYACEDCGKEYKYRKGLFRHKKTCVFKKCDEYEEKILNMKLDHKDELIDIYKKGTMGNNNTINSNNTNNISINVFLDEHCKDAKTLQDFISQISFKLEDVLTSNNFIKKDGITNVVIKNLEDLPKTERPIHCTDLKRSNFVVKDKDAGWIKDTGDKSGKIYSEVEKLRMNAYVELNDEIEEKFPDPKSDDIYMMKSSITEAIISENDTELDKRNTAVIKEIAKMSNIKDTIDELNN